MSSQKVPEAENPFRHKIEVQLRFNDVDIFGHVNNSVYLQFFDLGKLRYFETVLGADFQKSGLAVVVANINCDFFSPAFMNEALAVLTQCERIGEKSMILHQRIINLETDEVKCVARTVMVGFDPATLKSAAIPDVLTSQFEHFENRKMTKS
ncbi:MAG: acyl-CoA thioesterase [Muribaculaceae bacterium]|nr:acyl-CoA thioesterase [Muribaculaceae bacterium]